MSTTISRLYNWVTDKGNNVKITASRMDAENDQIITALNRKVLCSASAPGSPIAGQTWFDTTNKYLKVYRNNEWCIITILHVGSSAPATVQEGDVWYDTTNNALKAYNGSTWDTLAQNSLNYRSGLMVKQASTSTLTVSLGTVEVNGQMITKTSVTTLTISTAGDWAGGSSLRATSTYFYVGIDASGNIKLHTTAPTHSDYAVSNTNGIKRYATWSGTVYRIIGWGYMNATGSGELYAYEVGSISDGDVDSTVMVQGTSNITTTSTSYTDMTDMAIHYYATGKPVKINFTGSLTNGTGGALTAAVLDIDGAAKQAIGVTPGGNDYEVPGAINYVEALSQGTHTIKMQWKAQSTTTAKQNGATYARSLMVSEK